jgi:hydrophobe/amphiphile efflux-3 (HAE3) family protein
MNKTAELIVKYRWYIIIAFIATTIIFAIQIPNAEIDSDVKSQLPPNIQSRLTLDKIENIFGGTDMAMILFETDDIINKKTLTRLKKISRKVNRIKGVDRVLSLFELKEIKGEDGAMIVNPAVGKIPENETEKEELRENIKNNDIVYGSVISEDFKVTSVIAMLRTKVKDEYIFNEMKKIVKKYPGTERVSYGGLPITRVYLSHDIRNDLRKFMPFGLLIMLIFLFVCFRQLRGVLLPFFTVVMSIFIAMGLIPMLGWKIQMITILLPVIMIAIANDYGIHIIARYQEENIDGNVQSKSDLAKNVFLNLGKPVMATGITTVAGMLCLLSHIIVPAEQLGILASAGILFALAASLFFIPAILAIIPKAKSIIQKDIKKSHILEKVLHSLAGLVASYPKAIIVSTIAVAVFLAIGINFIVVDTNPENFYPEDSPLVQASRTINQKMGGANAISAIISGDIKDPRILNKIDKFEKELRAMPDIGNTTSLARVVRQMSRALNDKEEGTYNRIPQTRNAIAQYFELYSMSGDPDDFEKLVDFPYENSQIIARIKSPSSEVIKRVVREIEGKFKGDKDFTDVGGFASIFAELVDKVVYGQTLSLLLSLVIVAILVMILFRSVIAGLIGAVPLGLALVLLFGLMGFLGIELNVATAMLSSILIGVGIDYTIHFLWRYREERKTGHEPSKAVQITLTTAGRGIIFNALSVVIGFTVLLISNFLPVQFFGFLVVFSISTCLVGAIIIMPAICLLIRPKFLEP